MAVSEANLKGVTEMAKVRMNKRSQLTIPKAIVKQLDIKEGDQLEIFVDEMGRIVIEPTIAVPRSQAYFWTERWQAQEHVADADIQAGRLSTLSTEEELDAYLERMTEDKRR